MQWDVMNSNLYYLIKLKGLDVRAENLSRINNSDIFVIKKKENYYYFLKIRMDSLLLLYITEGKL